MKLLDATEGIRMTITCTAFQFVFMVSLLNLFYRYIWYYFDATKYTETGRIDMIAYELLSGHFLVFVLLLCPQLVRNCISAQKWYAIDNFCKLVAVFGYGRTLIVACTNLETAKAFLAEFN